MAVEITIQVESKRWKTLLKPYTKTVQNACSAALSARKIKKGELAVVLANDAFVRDLNKTYRGKNKPTNVLSFPGQGDALGDIVLAHETIAREAREQGKRFKDHATHLLVHGVLHLSGLDHEADKEAEAMENMEVKILKKLDISNPYL